MPVKIEHRLGVRTPAEVIWALVADLEHWADWNPLYPAAQGAVRMGERLTLELALPGHPVRTIRPTIIDWVPNEQIHWRLSLAAGQIRTTRYIEIEALSETGCIFSNGEVFAGLLGPPLARRLRKDLRAGFAAMGEAVKARAEQAWREAGGALT